MSLVDHIILNESAYFYKIPGGFTLPASRVNQIFTDVSRDRIGHYTLKIVKQAVALGTVSVYYSICIFKFEVRPSFLDEDYSDVVEIKYAYLLLVEYLEYLVIAKKYITDLKVVDDLEPLDYLTISRGFVTEQTKFERFSMKNMDIANTAVRNKTIEANDIKESMSNLGANRYIVNNMRVRDANGTKSLSFNTSRISDIDKKVKIVPLLNWVVRTVNRAKAFSGIASFMDVFAIPVDFEEYADQLIPASILFSIAEIKSDIEEGRIDSIVYDFNGENIDVSMVTFVKALDSFNAYSEVVDDEEDASIFKIINNLDKTLRLKVNKKSITVSSSKLKKLAMMIGDRKVNMLQYLNQLNSFIVTFDQLDLIYFSRKLFKDNKLLTSIESFLSAFITNDQLANTQSEKGVISPTSTSFEPTSVFGVIESSVVNNAAFLFCDDLGNEWADYISIEGDTINFYHGKSNGQNPHGISASKFQDVVGQALKNLGNLVPADHQWSAKIDKWNEFYSGSQISRLRIGTTVQDGVDAYRSLIFKPNIRKRIFIVVDFISKENLTNQFRMLLREQLFIRKNEVVQILWFVSSLLSTCSELGYEVYIVCQP